jgi:hypothetical protein
MHKIIWMVVMPIRLVRILIALLASLSDLNLFFSNTQTAFVAD